MNVPLEPNIVAAVLRDVLGLATDLEDAYRTAYHEDAWPTRRGEPVPGRPRGEVSDPTGNTAAARNARLELAVNAMHVARENLREATREVRALNPPDAEMPRTGRCRNCPWKEATHPKRAPERCEACDRHLRRYGDERPARLIEAERTREVYR